MPSFCSSPWLVQAVELRGLSWDAKSGRPEVSPPTPNP